MTCNAFILSLYINYHPSFRMLIVFQDHSLTFFSEGENVISREYSVSPFF